MALAAPTTILVLLALILAPVLAASGQPWGWSSFLRWKPRSPWLEVPRHAAADRGVRMDGGSNSVNIWPLPAQFSRGHNILRVHPSLELVVRGAGGSSKTVSDAFERYLTIIFQHQVDVTRIDEEEGEGKPWLRKLVVIVSSADEVLQLNTSEEYGLQVPVAVADEEESGLAAYLEAETVYGAVRGLETLSQLCVFNFTSKSVEVADAPWRIQDRPRFRYRGLLIDTGRHFQPVKIIKEVLDAMSYAKLNVLHWHLVDEEAFPLEVPSRPKLWEGAYSSQERYTLADAAEVVEYARQRGIHVMPEIDVPGHAASWGRGYPELWPSQTCQEPLDVSNNFTFETVDAILADLRAVFPFELFHLGGDEVDPSCWEHVPRVRSWLQERGLSGRQAYAGFVVRAQQLAAARGWDPVNWEEPFNLFPTKLHRRTVVHNWWAPGLAPRIVQAGFRCIVSNQDVWYLDHLDVPWEAFYLNEPLKGVADEAGAELVIGGEVCMWGRLWTLLIFSRPFGPERLPPLSGCGAPERLSLSVPS